MKEDHRIYICADMEGVTGIVSRRETDDLDSHEYRRACELFEAEVLACVHAAYEAGASEVVVSDSHGPATNLDIRRFPAPTRLVQGWPRPLNMMEGIQDGSFAGAILLGHHTAITSIDGGFPHTCSSSTYTAVRINGLEASETMINAMIAGHFGVPVIAVTGDAGYIAHARELLGDIAFAETKRDCGMYAANQLVPEIVHDLIRQATHDGIARISSLKPLLAKTPITLELDMRDRFFAHVLSFLPGFEQTAGATVTVRCETILEVASILGGLVHLRASYD